MGRELGEREEGELLESWGRELRGERGRAEGKGRDLVERKMDRVRDDLERDSEDGKNRCVREMGEGREFETERGTER